jgi:hypothetical protein
MLPLYLSPCRQGELYGELLETKALFVSASGSFWSPKATADC